MVFDRPNILVTGGAGFIGSHLCDELVKIANVICVDNFITGNEHNIDHLLVDPNFVFLNHDINIPLNLDEIKDVQKFKVQFHGVKELYNLACPTSVLNFDNNKEANLLANSYGMKNMLDLAVKYKAKFLQFSSSVVYGTRTVDVKRIDEEYLGLIDPLSKRASYDEGKRFSETMVSNYAEIHGIDAKIMRLFRTYGPRMPLKDGQMIPDFVDNALDDKDLVIYGDENFTTSLCYVKDVVDASVRFMASNTRGPLNIGSDVEINLTNLAQKIINMTEARSQIAYADQLLFMTPLPMPDISRAVRELGWLPVITLEKGLQKTIEDLESKKGRKKM